MNSLVNYINNYDLHTCKLYLPVYTMFYFTYPVVKKLYTINLKNLDG